MTTSAYKPLTVAEQVFKTIVWDTIVKGGEIALEGYVPFLALPVIKQVDEGIIDAISNWMYSNLCLATDVAAIQLVNAEHQAAYTRASVNLLILAHDKGVASKEYQDALITAKNDFIQFISFGK